MTNKEKKPIFNRETGQHELNGIPFNGHFFEWKLEYLPNTYLKESELSGDEYRKGGEVCIHLNGDCVLRHFCREPERALILLGKYLDDLQCWFENNIGIPYLSSWKEDIIGKKVRHGSIPSTVESYCGDGEIVLKRDDGKLFMPDLYPALYREEGDGDDWKDRDRVHITDKRINWNI